MPLRIPRAILPQTLFMRALLIVVVPIILVQAISTYVFYDRHWDAISRRLSINLANQVSLIGDALQQNQTDKAANMAKQLAMQQTSTTQAIWQAVGPPDQRFLKTLHKELAMRLSMPFKVAEDSRAETVFIYLQPSNEEAVQVLQFDRKQLYSSTVYIVVLWSLGASILLLMVALVFMRNQIRPIRRLAKAAEAFGSGQQRQHLKPQGATEVRQAIRAFNSMQARLLEYIEQRTLMLAGISHDLRTPLTRLKLQLALLEDSLPADEYAECQRNLDEMQAMLTAYLAYAKDSYGEERTVKALDEMLEVMQADYSRLGKQVTLATPLPKVSGPVYPMALQRALRNIIDNGLRHGTAVHISLKVSDSSALIILQDNGPGIAADQATQIFKPFYRAATDRPSTQGSVGLGLAIADEIIKRHEGTLRLVPSEKGAVFEIGVPVG